MVRKRRNHWQLTCPPLATCTFATLLLASVTLAAQTPADRAAMDAFRDTLGNTGNLEALKELDRGKLPGPLGLVRAGLIDLRRGELGGGRGAYDEAVMTIEEALARQGDWPYAWYALGLVRFGMWNRRFVVKETRFLGQGISYRRGAMDAFAKAIEKDPTFVPAADALAGLVTAMGHRLLSQDFLPPLQAASTVAGMPPEVWLGIFRLDFGGGRYDKALEDLGGYLRLGGDSGMARVEQARALFALDRQDKAVKTYFEGLGQSGETGRAAYRADLAWVATDWELAQLDSLRTDQVAEWITRFWRERDALALRTANERIREHLRRWVFVHQNYLIHRPDDAPIHGEGLTDSDLRGVFDDESTDDVLVEVGLGVPRLKTYVRTQWEVDDRGVIYLRHGEPAQKVASAAGPPNESWAYDLPEGRRVFHFLGSRALGTSAATTLVAALPIDATMLDARASLDTRYADLASRIQRFLVQARSIQLRNRVRAGTAGADDGVRAPPMEGMDATGGSRFSAAVLQREVMKNQRAIAAAVATDGFPQHFKKSLDAIVQVYGVGFGQGETRRVLAVFAVPGKNLIPKPRPDGGPGVLYPITLRLIAMDRERGLIRELDTTRTFLSRDTLKGEQYLTGLMELTVPPGRYQVRTLVTAPGLDAATGAGRDSVEIPPSPKDLVLSDLILGRPESGLAWTYSGTKVPLNPLNAYPKGADADLFYEVGGLLPGTAYEVATAVRKADEDPGSKPAVQSGFEFSATAPYQQVTRGLGLTNLKPGAYLLQVTVKEPSSSREVTRYRALNILEK
jgi:tetratricopeptide (TPR) repeat protein